MLRVDSSSIIEGVGGKVVNVSQDDQKDTKEMGPVCLWGRGGRDE